MKRQLRFAGVGILALLYFFGLLPVVIALANAHVAFANVGAIVVLAVGTFATLKLASLLCQPTKEKQSDEDEPD